MSGPPFQQNEVDYNAAIPFKRTLLEKAWVNFSARVAGVPPDYFSAQGQLWGNPVYDWESLGADGYRWCIDRVRSLLAHVDLIRLDHFWGFDAAWYIPAGAPMAKSGKWVPGPSEKFFVAAQKELGSLPFTADILTIRGERKFEKKVDENNYLRVERSYGSFSRSFSLANTLNAEAIQADYKNGVLTLSISKREEAKPKQTKVRVEGVLRQPLRRPSNARGQWRRTQSHGEANRGD